MAVEIPQSGKDRYDYLERKLAEARARELLAPQDHDNLNKLGAALQELSQCENDGDATNLLTESIEVLGRARNLENQEIDRAHETLWLLGSAHAYRASIPTRAQAMKTADRAQARIYFIDAREADRNNDLYRRTDPRDQIQMFLMRNWGWGAAGAATLAGLCAGFFHFRR